MCYCAESLSRTGTSAEIGPHLPDWLALGTEGVKIGSAISIIPVLFVFSEFVGNSEIHVLP